MTTIDKYISNLLYLHDCVIVPGLGGFVANRRPVEIRESQHLFLPPVKEIGFNRSLLHNDGLLATYIAHKEMVTYAEAVNIIDRFVNNICSKILSGKTVDLGETGTLCKDAMGNILFSPKEGSSFLPDFMGFDSFRFLPLEQKRAMRIEFQDDYILQPNRKPIRYWIVAASLAVFFTFFSTELKMPSVSQAGVGEPFFTYSNYSEQFENNVQEDETVFTSTVSDMEDENPSVNYHIIAGSFKHTTSANRALSECRSAGFEDAAILNDGDGRIRISLCTFSDKEKALEKLEEFRQQRRFSATWVLTEK
ncbi:MAG: SPOR domain-containing protein [Cytophagaceae bacterium]|jgi:hypothetical protein|nr:SPOR domain-containing protein [Cytophagaceae bacterium]